MISRRRVLQAGLAGSASFSLVAGTTPSRAASSEAGVLDASTIEKYTAELVIPPVMPVDGGAGADTYTIGVRQFRQQVLPPGRPATTVWGYGSTGHPDTFHYPAYTIEARYGRTVQVTWAGSCGTATSWNTRTTR